MRPEGRGRGRSTDGVRRNYYTPETGTEPAGAQWTACMLASLTDAQLFGLWTDLSIPDGSDLLNAIDAERFTRWV
jgi:hypothetical protein